MRHNSVRDSEAQIMREVCRDFYTEPKLRPINKNDFERKVNTANNSRLDIFTEDCGRTVRKGSV